MTRALIVLLSSAYIYYSEFLTKQYLYYISKKSCPILYSEKLYENAQDGKRINLGYRSLI